MMCNMPHPAARAWQRGLYLSRAVGEHIGAGGDEVGVSSPPSKWYILQVTQAPTCATKGLVGWVVVEQRGYAHSSDLLQAFWSLMCLLGSACSVASTSKIFFPLTNSVLQNAPRRIIIPGGERTAATMGLGLSLSLEADVVVVRTVFDQIKGSTDKFLLACISSLLCFVYVHSLSSQSFPAQ